MYQIFVVEDEVLIRESIRNTVQQMQGPYAFCGEASDEDALAEGDHHQRLRGL